MEDHDINVVWILICKRICRDGTNGESNEDDLLPFFTSDLAGAELLDQLMYCLYVGLRLCFEEVRRGRSYYHSLKHEMSNQSSKWSWD